MKNVIEITDIKKPKDFTLFANIITRSPAMQKIFWYLESIAENSEPVLITGETGTGKELIAAAIHKASKRTGPYLAVNIAGFDDTVFSDVLFGHVKGAYTGADLNRDGLLLKASGGTLFLDEIGDLSISSQVKLLRLIEYGEYLPLGSDEIKKTDVKIITATNNRIWENSRRNRFRKDVYYRLISCHIHLPPLRKRLTTDLIPLVNYLVENTAARFNITPPEVPDELYALLRTYAFPGNIRELELMIRNALSKNDNPVLSLTSFQNYLANHAPQNLVKKNPATEVISITTANGKFPNLKEVEKHLVIKALELSKGKQSKAARLLGVSQSTISRKIKSLQIPCTLHKLLNS